MPVANKEKIEAVIELIDNISVNPDVSVDYCIPEILTTVEDCGKFKDPYIQFTYLANAQHPHIKYMPLKEQHLKKTPEDLVNMITFSLEQFIEEIDSTLYGAQ